MGTGRFYAFIAAMICVCFTAGSLYAEDAPKTEHHHFAAVVDTVLPGGSEELPVPKLFDRQLPRLLLTGKKGRFYIGIGGGVKATVGMDWGHPVSDPNSFAVSKIPMKQPSGDGARFSVSAQQTELFLCFGAFPGEKHEVGAYINGMFLGDNYAFVLENAYVRFLGFTAGYGYGLFCDTGAAPATIDYQGPNALLSSSSGIFDYVWRINPRWYVGVGVEVPIASYEAAAQCGKVSQRIPDIPAMIQWNYCHGGHLRASALLRNIQYRDLVSSMNRTCVGYGLQLSGAGPLAGPLGFYFQTAFGRGISAYFQDVGALNQDLLPETDVPGRMEAVKAWGAFAALQYDFSSSVHASVMYSHLRLYPHNVAADSYRYGQYACANIFWHITPIVSCGMEYIYGRRVDLNGQQAHDNRLQAMFKVQF